MKTAKFHHITLFNPLVLKFFVPRTRDKRNICITHFNTKDTKIYTKNNKIYLIKYFFEVSASLRSVVANKKLLFSQPYSRTLPVCVKFFPLCSFLCVSARKLFFCEIFSSLFFLRVFASLSRVLGMKYIITFGTGLSGLCINYHNMKQQNILKRQTTLYGFRMPAF